MPIPKLCLYTVLDYPTRAVWEMTHDVLADYPVLHETSVVESSPSAGIGAEIHGALCHLRDRGITASHVARAYRVHRPNVAVIHAARALAPLQAETLVASLKDAFSILLPSGGSEAIERATRHTGNGLAIEVAPYMSSQSIVKRARTASSLIYLQCAEATGGSLYDLDRLAHVADTIRNADVDVPIYAGFGIKGPDDARRLVSATRVDGVIIGSQLVAHMRSGCKYSNRTYAARLRGFVDELLAAVHEGDPV